VFAIFSTASAALNRALEIQRALESAPATGQSEIRARIRIGLHIGEIFIKDDKRVELISRHVNRAHRVMEIAAPGQILASQAVVEAAKDFINIPKEFLAVRYYGEYYLKGVGATDLCEVADLRFRKPEAPKVADSKRFETALLNRIELAGHRTSGKL